MKKAQEFIFAAWGIAFVAWIVSIKIAEKKRSSGAERIGAMLSFVAQAVFYTTLVIGGIAMISGLFSGSSEE